MLDHIRTLDERYSILREQCINAGLNPTYLWHLRCNAHDETMIAWEAKHHHAHELVYDFLAATEAYIGAVDGYIHAEEAV